MSQDGRPQAIPVDIEGDGIKLRPCPCGGKIYALGEFAKCNNGEYRCMRCMRPARRFRKGWSCGSGCKKLV